MKPLRLFLLVAVLLLTGPALTWAQEPVVGEIIMWAGDGNPPAGWLECNGTSAAIATYPELYDLIGVNEIYGPSTGTHFTLPDFRARLPVGVAPDEFGTQYTYFPGDTGGEELHLLTIGEMPAHDHDQQTNTGAGAFTPIEWRSGGNTMNATLFKTGLTGDGDPHNNMPPYLAVNFIIRAVSVSTTPTPTPTPGPTPTATPTPIAPYVYTQTLQSGHLLAVPVQVSFGQLMISGSLLAVSAILVLDFAYRMVYRK